MYIFHGEWARKFVEKLAKDFKFIED